MLPGDAILEQFCQLCVNSCNLETGTLRSGGAILKQLLPGTNQSIRTNANCVQIIPYSATPGTYDRCHDLTSANVSHTYGHYRSVRVSAFFNKRTEKIMSSKHVLVVK